MSTKHLAGFTFLELLLALVIVAVVAGSAFETLQIAFNTKHIAERAIDSVRKPATAMDFLQRDLESALPPTGLLANAFTGYNNQDDRGNEGDDLIFYAATDTQRDADMPADVVQLEYTTETKGSDHVLVRRVIYNLLPPSAIDSTQDEEVLCRGVHAFTLQYFDVNNIPSGTPQLESMSGYPSWDSTQPASDIGPQQSEALPLALLLTLDLDPPEPGQPIQRIMRIIPMNCAVPATQPATGGAP